MNKTNKYSIVIPYIFILIYQNNQYKFNFKIIIVIYNNKK